MDNLTYIDLGYDAFFQKIQPPTSGMSALDYDAMFEDGSVYSQKILGNSIEAFNIKSINASAIVASTLISPVNVGSGESGEFLKIDGPGNRILIHDISTNRILIGKATNSGT